MLGSNNNQNGKSNSYDPSYYSRISFKNDKDKLRLGFTYWKGCLKISITEVKSFDANNSSNKSEDLAYIHLSPTKAQIFADYVDRINKNPEENKPLGVNTGASDTNGLITIGREEGRPFLLIAKIDKDGNFVQQQRFNFNFNYHYGLKIHDLKDLSFEKQFVDDIELTQFHQILTDFARSSNGAYGASAWDIGRYELNSKLIKPVAMIMEKLGIEKKGGYGGNRGNAGDSYFANNGGGSSASAPSGSSSGGYSSGSINDLESEFDD